MKGLDKGNLWEINSLFVSLPVRLSLCVLCVSSQAGKKAVRAVLWVSADGLRVVDDKTKVLKDSELIHQITTVLKHTAQ